MDKMEFRETLCNNHNDTIYDCTELIKEIKGLKIASDSKNSIINRLKLIKNRSKYCKKQGQRLENRCRSYRMAIEDLGFERINKPIDKKKKV